MPYGYGRDDQHRRIRVTIDDTCTFDDLIASVHRQLTEGAWGFALLVDARGMSTPPEPENVRSFVTYVRGLVAAHGPRGPIAIVARASGAVAGAQIYKVFGDKRDLEVFWDLGDAQKWLDEQGPQ